MKENKYDDAGFFRQYSLMSRSVKGLEAAGEWHVFRSMLPELKGKRVLDLGCGYGWHCKYAAEQGASSVVGVDISEKMLNTAMERNTSPSIEYRHVAIEDADFPDGSFDVVLSSLAFHYVQSFDAVCAKVSRLLAAGGDFVFSVEHPVYTACAEQDWCYGPEGRKLHWPVDGYFNEGLRMAGFLGHVVMKYHRTVADYVNALLSCGFRLTGLSEPEPDPALLEANPEYADELRRPMFLILSAKK